MPSVSIMFKFIKLIILGVLKPNNGLRLCIAAACKLIAHDSKEATTVRHTTFKKHKRTYKYHTHISDSGRLHHKKVYLQIFEHCSKY